GPALAHADPTRAVVVLFALAIPVKLNAHASELVDVDLLAGRADDARALKACDARARGHDLWGPTSIDERDRGFEAERAGLLAAQNRVGDEQRGVELASRMILHEEHDAGREVDAVRS